jgi:hypothetical protein
VCTHTSFGLLERSHSKESSIVKLILTDQHLGLLHLRHYLSEYFCFGSLYLLVLKMQLLVIRCRTIL